MRASFERKPLASIADAVQYGYTASASDEQVGPKFLRITDIAKERLSWATVPYCSISDADHEKYRLANGDIVIARTGATVGYAKYLHQPPDAVFASYLVRVRVAPDHDPRYVGYVVTSDEYKRFILANAGGAAQPNASAKVLSSFPVPVPSLNIQRKIATIVAAYDDLIENKTRRIQILEEMAQAIYREWFVEFRFPGCEGRRLVESELGRIPEGWSVVPLKEAATVVMGQSPKSQFYNDQRDGLPFHQGVTNFGAHFPTHRTYSTAGDRRAVDGDILFSVRAPVGRINVANGTLILGRGLCGIRPALHPLFVLFQLKWRFREEDSMGSGAIFNAVKRSDVELLPVLAPPAEVAAAYESLVDPMFMSLRNLTAAGLNLRASRDLLLPRLISGEIDVSDLDIDTSGLVA